MMKEDLKYREMDKAEFEAFTSCIPSEWKEILLNEWHHHKNHARPMGLFSGESLLCGGILFYQDAPELGNFGSEAAKLFAGENPYIGFLFTPPAFRGKGWARAWIEQTRRLHREKCHWLVVEDPTLLNYYRKLGFFVVEASSDNDEWLLSVLPMDQEQA
ncbi:GNAT family N-acetyltransferase [Robertkochia aurantiaca]|uniref:GNAT family N-acetyltransferase n=1 Tax=Robertkochia aurantiaca TaxID=2873700 RepID=UPI001CCC1849|nr:GNAT family N-acetyltransferase [Robertkochia sp. 3YJGBD-33]